MNVIFPIMFIVVAGIIIFSLVQGIITWNKNNQSPRFYCLDPSAVNKELLKSATVNAREKAEILCEASGVKLGELLTIDYNWGELNIISHTDYMMEEKCMANGIISNQ